MIWSINDAADEAMPAKDQLGFDGEAVHVMTALNFK